MNTSGTAPGAAIPVRSRSGDASSPSPQVARRVRCESPPGSRHAGDLPRLDARARERLLALPGCWLEGRAWDCVGADPQLLWAYLERHGLDGVAGALALAGRMEAGALAAGARDRYMGNLMAYRRVAGVCDRVAGQARALNMPIGLLKGPALVRQAYRDPGARSFGDIDLFVASQADAWALLRGLGCGDAVDKGQRGFAGRLRDPGKISARLEGVELEIAYPPARPSDAMHGFLAAHAGRVLALPGAEGGLPLPDPSAHFVYLILHMLGNHWCERLVLLLDLVVLERQQRAQLDPAWIDAVLGELQLRAAAGRIAAFCRRFLDPGFPALGGAERGWNGPFLDFLTAPENLVRSRLGLHHAQGRQRRIAQVAHAFGYLLLGDDVGSWRPRRDLATVWSAARVLRALRLADPVSRWLLQWLIFLLVRPLVRGSTRLFRSSLSRPV